MATEKCYEYMSENFSGLGEIMDAKSFEDIAKYAFKRGLDKYFEEVKYEIISKCSNNRHHTKNV